MELSRVKETEYAQWGMQIAHVCMYIHTHGALPGLATSKGLPLGAKQARARLVHRLLTFVRAHDLAHRSPARKLKIIVESTEDASKKVLSDADDGALLLATVINMADMMARDQRTRFPDHPTMRHVVKNLTGLLMPVMRQILGTTLPSEIRYAWPDFATLFDAYKSPGH